MNVSLDMVPEEENDDVDDGPEGPLMAENPIAPPVSSNRLRINVGGQRHETYKSTLQNIPDTRLAWLASASTTNNADFDPHSGEFFFDRHPIIFNAILNYYRTGRLHAPSDVCGPAFEDELQFWGIDEKQIEPCCWSNYTQHRDAQETLAKLQGDTVDQSDEEEDGDDVARIFGIEEETSQTRVNWYTKWRPRIWKMLEEPYSSRAAKIMAITSLIFVMISITAFCMETATPFQQVLNNTETETTYIEPLPFLFAIEGVCVAFFTLELIVRFAFCPNKCRFFLTLETIIDIVACVPFYVDAVNKLSRRNAAGNDVLSFLRIVRVFRIFKLARHLSGLQVLGHTLKASAKELLLLIIFMGLGVLISSSLVYYAERWASQPGDRNDFDNIPVGFWWAVITMTTVGYGDRVPRTWLGMIVGAITAIIGVLTLALPVPVIVNNFALYYTHAQARQKLPKKRKRVLVGAADALKTQSTQFMSSSISGYSTQSTNEAETTSLHSEDMPIRTVSGSIHKSGNSVVAPMTAKGEKTGITVTLTDEVKDEATAPVTSSSPVGSHGGSESVVQSNNRRHSKRNSLAVTRRDSIRPNGVGVLGRRESVVGHSMSNGVKGRSRAANGVRQPQSRRRSMMPSMPEVPDAGTEF